MRKLRKRKRSVEDFFLKENVESIAPAQVWSTTVLVTLAKIGEKRERCTGKDSKNNNNLGKNNFRSDVTFSLGRPTFARERHKQAFKHLDCLAASANFKCN